MAEKQVLLLTTVDIEDQSKEVIVREGDDPRDVALAFCLENGLNENVMDALAEHLIEQIRLQEAELVGTGVDHDVASAVVAAPEPEPVYVPAPVASAPAPAPAPASREVAPEPELQKALSPDARATRISEPEYYSSSALNDKGRPAFVTDSTVMSEQPGVSQSVDALSRKKKAQQSSGVRASSATRASVGNDAFERLYARAEQTRAKHDQMRKDQMEHVNKMTQSFVMTQTKFRPTSGGRRQIVADLMNPGDRLYAEGILRKKAKEEGAAKARREEEEERYKEECTFKPSISHLAQRLVPKNDLSAWERLHENAKRKQEILRASIEQRKVEEPEDEDAAKECTFRPAIDAKSAKMMGDRTEALRGNAITVFDQLSQDALRRRMRLEEYANWFPEEATFQPRILDASRAMVDKRQTIYAGEGKTAAEKRLISHQLSKLESFAPGEQGIEGHPGAPIGEQLINRGRVAEMKVNQMRASKDNAVDPFTGKRMFQPETGRPPAFGRELNGMSVNQFLYERGMDAMKKKQEMGKMLEEKKRRESAGGKFVNPTSQKMLEKLKRKRFRKIYEYLRQVLEQEGLAPPHPADQAALEADFSPFLEDGSPLLDDLDPEVRRDVDVVLQIAAQEQLGHLSDGQVLLDDGLFMHLMEQVVQGPRDYLQPGSSRREAVEEFTFRPTINTDEESLRMVARRRPSHMKIYEILFAEKNSKEEKIQALKHHIEEERNRECRFEPETNKTFVQSRFMRPPAQGAPRSVNTSQEAGAYDDLEREVRNILEKHSGPNVSSAAAVDELHELIGGGAAEGTAGIMNRLAQHVEDSPPLARRGDKASMPWE